MTILLWLGATPLQECNALTCNTVTQYNNTIIKCYSASPTTIQGPTVHYKVSRVNGDSYEEKALNKMRLECSSECWMIVNVSNWDRKTVPDVRTADFVTK